MAEGGDSESVLVKLTRMEGKLDLSNLRHDQHDHRFGTIEQRLHAHGNRIGVLEARNHLSEGERKGVLASGKLLYTLLSLVVVGIGGLLLRAFGA